MKDEIVITREHLERLQKASEFLDCLEACGVDNWHGYVYAIEMMEDEYED